MMRLHYYSHDVRRRCCGKKRWCCGKELKQLRHCMGLKGSGREEIHGGSQHAPLQSFGTIRGAAHIPTKMEACICEAALT